jgi:glycerate dehydrogenase
MHRVAVTYKVKEANRALLRELFGTSASLSFLDAMAPPDRKQALEEADAVLTWNLPKELREGELALLGNVGLIQLLSAGADHVPYGSLPPQITIASNVGAYAEPMAEHVLAMTLTLAKNLIREHRNLAQGVFNQSRTNRMLRGMVCGILGFGGIGKATARLMRNFGMHIRLSIRPERPTSPWISSVR